MYNSTEISAVKLSPTKKDFYQIWNELIEVAGKLSERWDPAATNESDPGVVLLKVLTAIADKLNYNIDANTLEAFLPSAAQESSVRKLCDMLGYPMKYYQSATTKARITYHGSTFPSSNTIFIDQFTNLKDIDDKINYITTESATLSPTQRSVEVTCMEGELIACSTDNQNIIALHNLDDNFRYYLPESQIAANGIFISNVLNVSEVFKSWLSVDKWERVDNLNTREPESKIYTFGYDSSMGLPYVQFPEDISSLIGNGLNISYVRTKGNSGNISVNTLYKLEKPGSWASSESSEEGEAKEDGDWTSVDNYSVTNVIPSRNGVNPESIDSAYWNFKKTIGTFDTLVTCRDYMNKIYQLVDETTSRPLVSNIIASDIRDDINNAHTLCTMTDSGIEYISTANVDANSGTKQIERFEVMLYPFTSTIGNFDKADFLRSFTYAGSNSLDIEAQLEDNKTLAHAFKYPDAQDILCIKNYYLLSARINTTYKVSQGEADNIQEVVHKALYKAFNMRQMQFGQELPYDEILATMESADSRIKSVGLDDPVLRTVVQLVDGTEIPILNIPKTKIASSVENTELCEKSIGYYKELVCSNILAGRISLFSYNTDFAVSYKESVYPGGYFIPYYEEDKEEETPKFEVKQFLYANDISSTEEAGTTFQVFDFDKNDLVDKKIKDETALVVTEVRPRFEVDLDAWADANSVAGTEPSYLELAQNEAIQFRLPNLKTTMTYPAYVNYYLNLNSNGKTYPAIPATIVCLEDFFSNGFSLDSENKTSAICARLHWEDKVVSLYTYLQNNSISFENEISPLKCMTLSDKLNLPTYRYYGSPIFTIKEEDNSTSAEMLLSTTIAQSTKIFYLVLDASTFYTFKNWLKTFQRFPYKYPTVDPGQTTNIALDTTYRFIYEGEDSDCNRLFTRYSNTTGKSGKLYAGGWRYKEQLGYVYDLGDNTADMLKKTFVSIIRPESNDDNAGYTADGLGRDAIIHCINANTDYQLKAGEYILFNYSSSEGQAEGVAVPKNIFYGQGSIIRPNIDLLDSKDQSAVKSFNKTTGYGPFIGLPTGSGDIAGMYTLGAQDQVEIREPIIITLDEPRTNVYWHLKSDSNKNTLHRLFTNAKDNTYSYLLQPGEYFFYTDESKQDLVYYGAGTELKLRARPEVSRSEETAVANAFVKVRTDDEISVEDIIEYGYVSALPWVSIDLDRVSLDIVEYQYINLTSGDLLKSIEIEIPSKDTTEDTTEDTSIASGQGKLTSTFRPCVAAKYVCDGTESELPALDIEGYSWEVASFLGIDCSNSYAQVLTVHQTKDKFITKLADTGSTDKELVKRSKVIARTYVDLIGPDIFKTDVEESNNTKKNNIPVTVLQTFTPLLKRYEDGTFKAIDMALYSNKVLASSGTPITITDNEETETKLAFKVCSIQQLRINRNGYSELFTPTTGSTPNVLTFEQATTQETYKDDEAEAVEALATVDGSNNTLLPSPTLILHNIIPDENIGIISFYNKTAGDYDASKQENNLSTSIWLIPISYDNTSNQDPKELIKLFNYFDEKGKEQPWWTDCAYTEGYCYQLRPGLNTVCIQKTCDLAICADASCTSLLYFDNLQIIHADADADSDLKLKLNPKLNPKLGLVEQANLASTQFNVDAKYAKDFTDESKILDDLLAKIRSYDSENKFYYSNIYSKNIGLDLNDANEEDTLLVPYNWFDPQNICNKFIVPQIDADYLDDNVRISRFSKL